MSHDVRWCIQRPGAPITRAEWEAWLASEAGFSVTDKLRGSNPRTGRPINVPSSSAGLWSRDRGKTDVYFQFHEGKIYPIDPDEETIAKLSKIATALGAEVIRQQL